MTQPTEAVGGANDAPIVAAEPTLEDRLSAAMGEPEEKKPEEEAGAEAGAEPEALTVDDLGDDDGGEAGDPPIAAPVSWKDDAKDEFGKLPRALQETVAQREAEREKFVQTKSQEAAGAYTRAQQEALSQVQQIAAQHAQALQAALPPIYERPSYQLQVDDPIAFADQMDAHERSLAQHNHVQQQIRAAFGQAQQAEQILQQQSRKEFHTVLSQEYPEFLDPDKGPKLREKLGSIALELGFPAEALADVNAQEVLAMKRATEWKAKADKYDALMSQKMERVREAKNMPRVSRPGIPQGKGAAASEQFQSDRKAMRGGNKDAAVRIFSSL